MDVCWGSRETNCGFPCISHVHDGVDVEIIEVGSHLMSEVIDGDSAAIDIGIEDSAWVHWRSAGIDFMLLEVC